MFDVGFTEILLIGIVSLVVIGPERLPAVAKTAGQWIGKLQRFVKGVKTDLASEIESGDLKKLIGDQREQIDELRNMVSSARKDFQSTSRSVVSSTRQGLTELETSVKEAKADVADAGSTSGQNTEPSADGTRRENDVAATENTSANHDANPIRSTLTESGIDGLSAGDEPQSDQNATLDDPPPATRTSTIDLDKQ